MAEIRTRYSSGRRPLLVDTMLGVMWGAVFPEEAVYIIGPIMGLEANQREREAFIRTMLDVEEHISGQTVSLPFRRSLTEAIRGLPTVPTVSFFNDLAMLHCCLTGEHITRGDIEFLHQDPPRILDGQKQHMRDRHRVWMAEQALMRAVREGDVNHRTVVMDSASNISTGIQIEGKEPMQKARFSCVTFISLCTRAAIEGGLTPDVAYSVGDAYIQQIADSRTLSDMLIVNNRMYEDFILRVHNSRANPQISSQMQTCRDCIEMYLEEPLSLEILAQRVGYSSYYLARKFKRETGITVNDYIRHARIERAKALLVSTDDSVAAIAERLQFCSGSYFAGVFEQMTGMKPHEYRKKNQKQ